MSKPTIGRIIHYTLTEKNSKTLNTSGPSFSPRDFEEGMIFPAMVIRSTERDFVIQVFSDALCGGFFLKNVEEDSQKPVTGHPLPGTWHWPSRA